MFERLVSDRFGRFTERSGVLPTTQFIYLAMTLRKHVTKYKNMRKWMVEFLRKFENRAIKSGRDKSILITKINRFTIFYFNFTLCWGSVVMLTSLS